jgi:uncharacterized membrane-anchored protein YhcB (DUF1043 family)
MRQNRVIFMVSLLILSANCFATNASSTTAITGLDVAIQMQQFYDSAWIKLIWMIGALGLIAGAVIPYIMTRVQLSNIEKQKRKMQKMVDDAKTEMKLLIDEVKDKTIAEISEKMTRTLQPIIDITSEQIKNEGLELERKMIEKYDGQMKKMQDLSKKINITAGGAFHVQAYILSDKNLFHDAFLSYLNALLNYIQGKDTINTPQIIEAMKDRQRRIAIDEYTAEDMLLIDAIIHLLELGEASDPAKVFIPNIIEMKMKMIPPVRS